MFFLLMAAYLLIGVITIGWFMYGMTRPKTGEYITAILVWLFWPIVVLITLLRKSGD